MAPEQRDTRSGRGAGPNAADLMGVGVQLVISILVFLFAGRWLDDRLGTSPLLLILGVFVGFGASFYSLYRRLNPPRDGGNGRPNPPEGR